MRVIDHQPQAWFLLEDAGVLYLDARCSNSAVDYSVLIALNAAEISAYKAEGRAYLDRLAYDIHYSAPGVIGSTSPFKARNLFGSECRKADAAMVDWRAAHPE